MISITPKKPDFTSIIFKDKIVLISIIPIRFLSSKILVFKTNKN
jgi:hypothetical protein